jgi:hypothetical protein
VNPLRDFGKEFSAYLSGAARAWRLSISLHAPGWGGTIFIVIIP